MNRKVISSGIWFTISNFIVRSIGFITTPIFTRMLTKAEFGDYNNFATWASTILVITSLNLEASLIRARFDFEKKLNDYALSMICLSSLSTAVWYVIFLLLHSQVSDLFSIDEKYIHCMFLYLLFTPMVNIFQTMERFQYKYKLTVLTSMVVAIGTSLLSVVLVATLLNRLTGRIIGFVGPVSIVGTIILFYYINNKSRVVLSFWKYALPFTLPFIPHLLSMNLLSGMDRLMIKQICCSEDLALYSLAYTCGSIISIIVTSINSAYSPWLGEMMSKQNYERINKVSIPYVLLFCYFACVAVLVTPEVLYILGGKGYSEAMYVMPPVAASTILQFIYCMYVNVEQFEKKTKLMAFASVVSAASNYVLNYIFIRRFGYVAAAYTTYVSYFILMVLHILIVRHIGRSNVYNNRSVLLIAGLVSGLLFAMAAVMAMPIIRYAILAVLLIFGFIIAYKNKTFIKGFLKKG